jgi:hypothetical protein
MVNGDAMRSGVSFKWFAYMIVNVSVSGVGAVFDCVADENWGHQML